MKHGFTVQHYEHSTTRGFDEVIRKFEAAVGSVENNGFSEIASSARGVSEFEEQIGSREGSGGFMRFLTVDHGWMSRYGSSTRARMYTIGNPLIAKTMLRHSVAAGLNVPIRLLIYEDIANGTTCLTYDLPSSLMSALGNEEITEAAKKLDAKLIALAVDATGAEA